MPSQIDPTKPIDGVLASKADLRSNLQFAKNEIEGLQSSKADLGHQHVLADVTDSGALASKDIVQSEDIATAAITTEKLAAAAVGATKLADAAVTTAKLVNGAVTSDKLAAASVTVGKIAPAAVGTAELADDAVTTAKLAHGTANTLVGFDAGGSPGEVAAGSNITISAGTIAVVPGSLTDLTDTPNSYLAKGGMFLRANASETAVEFTLIEANAIADGAVATAKLADNAVSSAKIGPNAVGTANLADDAVTSDKIADGAVATAQLANAAVTLPKLASNSVDSGKIVAAAVGTDKIADGAVSTAKLAAAAVTSAKLAAEAVDSSNIVAAAVTAPKLADAAVTAPKLADAAVTAPKLAAGFLDPIEDADNHASTPFTVADAFSAHRFFTDAHNHVVQFPAGLSVDPAAHGRFTAPPANTLTLRRQAGSGVSINGVANDAYSWVVPAGGTVDWQVRAPNTIELRGDTTAEQLLAGSVDGDGQRIFGYRNRKYGGLAGAQTLSAANFEAGSKLVHTGAAATYTVASRLASVDTSATEELKVRNSGSGAITWAASGVTLIGATGTLPAGATAVLEWEHDGTTERVEIRSTA